MDQHVENETQRLRAPGRFSGWRAGLGVSERLLILIVAFIMLAEVLIYVPSIATFRNNWLSDKLASARTAALVLEAAPADSMPDATIQQILANLQARTITIKMGGTRRLLGVRDMPPMIDRQFDLRKPTLTMSILEAFDTLLFGGDRTVNVMGPAPMGGDFIDIVISERPLFDAMLAYSINILVVSLVVSGITAALVYFALHRIIVRPVSRIVANITAFAEEPEDWGHIIKPSGRRDELGQAESALFQMETALANQLKQQQRLAALGLAVSKVNHDLRNMLASVQLFSDRLAGLEDPTVQRFAPKLIAALDRAIGFCQSTLAFGKAQEPPPHPRQMQLMPLVEEVREMLGIDADGETGILWRMEVPQNFRVHADPEHLLRVLVNLGRNAIQALDGTDRGRQPCITVSASKGVGCSHIDLNDNGPGVPLAQQSRLFEAFSGSGRKGSTGLGLTIAADLVRAHGGTLSLLTTAQNGEMARPQGATFRISLPQRD
jgi:signal transduction histidine kinase